MKHTPLSQHRAFTLVELLTALVVIALLTGIVFSAIGKARNKAMLTACASNLRQIAMGMMLYAADENGSFPVATEVITGVGRKPWSQTLFERGYVAEPKVFFCPGDTLNATAPDALTGRPRAASYAYCMPIMGFSGKDSNGVPVYSQSSALNPAELDNPSQYYMLTEFHKEAGNWTTPYMMISLDTDRSHVSGTHPDGGRNVVFADGHVEWRTLEQLNRPEGWRLR